MGHVPEVLRCGLLRHNPCLSPSQSLGVAHGFQALENSITHYVSSKVYNEEFDSGVNIDSLNIEWPIKEKIMSSRDKNLPYFKPKIF